MNDADVIMVAARTGALLGIGIGIVISLVAREIVDAFREWRQEQEHRRQIRCIKDWK